MSVIKTVDLWNTTPVEHARQIIGANGSTGSFDAPEPDYAFVVAKGSAAKSLLAWAREQPDANEHWDKGALEIIKARKVLDAVSGALEAK